MLLTVDIVWTQDEHPPPGSPTRPPSALALQRLMDGAGDPGGSAHLTHLHTGLDAMAEEAPVGQVATKPTITSCSNTSVEAMTLPLARTSLRLLLAA